MTRKPEFSDACDELEAIRTKLQFLTDAFFDKGIEFDPDKGGERGLGLILIEIASQFHEAMDRLRVFAEAEAQEA